MRILKNIWSQLHRFLLWALLSSVFWAWIFGMVTNTAPQHKVVLYADVEECRDRELTLKLEEEKPESIRMIKVHPFSYAMFDDGELQSSDLYVVSASKAEQYLESFAPLDEGNRDFGDRELYRVEGVSYGVKIYDAASGSGAAKTYLGYEEDEDYYLFFNAASPHLEDGDGAALRVAETLLKLD